MVGRDLACHKISCLATSRPPWVHVHLHFNKMSPSKMQLMSNGNLSTWNTCSLEKIGRCAIFGLQSRNCSGFLRNCSLHHWNWNREHFASFALNVWKYLLLDLNGRKVIGESVTDPWLPLLLGLVRYRRSNHLSLWSWYNNNWSLETP